MTAIDMDESFFEKILQTHENNDKIKVLEVNKNLATAKGDNYLSLVYRVVVKYSKEENGKLKSNEEISFIVKSKPDNFIFGEKVALDCFKHEIYVFKNILPKIEKHVGCSIGPFHYLSDDVEGFIVMEDLGSKGYAMGNKFKGVSFEHCLQIIEKIAKFHAGSVAVHEKEPNLMKIFSGVSRKEIMNDEYFKFLEDSLTSLSENIEKTWKEKEYQVIASKLKNLISEVKTRVLAVFEFDADEFCVLNHGDLWVNNVMSKNKDDKLYDTILVDFQVVSYTSPAIDLQHILSMCPTLEFRGEKDDYFLELYLNILTNTMKKIGCKTNPPTLEQLKKAIFKRRIYSILTGLIYLPSILANKVAENALNVNVFDVPISVETVHKMTKIFLHKGYLD